MKKILALTIILASSAAYATEPYNPYAQQPVHPQPYQTSNNQLQPYYADPYAQQMPQAAQPTYQAAPQPAAPTNDSPVMSDLRQLNF